MDFFQFARYAEFFIPAYMDADGEVHNFLWIALLVGGLCFLIVYVFQAVGLYTIATRAGYKNRWMAFVPFFNLYYIGVCAQKNKVYNLSSKNFAIIVVILEVIMVLGYVLYYVASFSVWKYIDWNSTTIEGSNITYLDKVGFKESMPASLDWLGWVHMYMPNYVLSWLELVFIVVKLLLLMAFFRTYSARQYVIFSVVGALLPLTGILIYAVRNNTGMSYMDYLRRVREQNYRMYQQQYGNPYNNQNPYGGYNGNYGEGQGGQSNSAPDPFDEYGSGNSSSGNSSSGYSQGSGSSGSQNSSGNQNDSPFDDFK